MFHMDRYYAICCQPLVYRNKMTPVRVSLMLGGCWVIPSFISFLPIMQHWNVIGIEDIVSVELTHPASVPTSYTFLRTTLFIVRVPGACLANRGLAEGRGGYTRCARVI